MTEFPLPLSETPPGEARLTAQRPGRLEVAIDAPGRQLLVVSESYHSGWRAAVDGASQPVLRVNGDYLGCVVGPGKQNVLLEFRPESLRRGLLASFAGLGLTVATLVCGMAPFRRPRRAGGHAAMSYVFLKRPSAAETLLSVVLPVFNEAGALAELMRRIGAAAAACSGDYEIIFVDDGSTDQSPRVLDQLAAANGRVRVVHLSRNFGHQAAVQAGLAHSRGHAVVLMDSDLQDAPEAIPRFVSQWHAGFNVVYAIRVGRKENPLKRALFAAFHWLMSRVAASPDSRGRRHLRPGRSPRRPANPRPGGKRPLFSRSARLGRVPAGGNRRRAKRPLRCKPPRVALRPAPPGQDGHVLLLDPALGDLPCDRGGGLGGLPRRERLLALLQALYRLAIPGWTSYILVGSFFGALNALGISILGEYVVRIYDQVRGRPLYLVDRTVNIAGEGEQANMSADDRPYVELLEEAESLLQAAACPPQPADDPSPTPILLPIRPHEPGPAGE